MHPRTAATLAELEKANSFSRMASTNTESPSSLCLPGGSQSRSVGRWRQRIYGWRRRISTQAHSRALERALPPVERHRQRDEAGRERVRSRFAAAGQDTNPFFGSVSRKSSHSGEIAACGSVSDRIPTTDDSVLQRPLPAHGAATAQSPPGSLRRLACCPADSPSACCLAIPPRRVRATQGHCAQRL